MSVILLEALKKQQPAAIVVFIPVEACDLSTSEKHQNFEDSEVSTMLLMSKEAAVHSTQSTSSSQT